jgi:hypothetical protein
LTTSVSFQYGTTTNYGLTAAAPSQTGSAFRNVSANIGELSAHTIYHFRIIATNSAGNRLGSDRTFTTPEPITLEQVTQLISASQGGVITLPGGSSVSIPAGVLANDLLVTLSLLSSMPSSPPSGLLISVGHALSISFAQPHLRAIHGNAFIGASNQQINSTDSLQFVLNLGSNPINGIAGSAPLADIVDLTAGDEFLGIPGSFNSTTRVAQFSVPAAAVQNGQTVIAGQTNLNPFTFAPPPRFGGRIWNPALQHWLDFPQGFDPSKKTLVLTHGILSSVEDSYGSCVDDIIAAGGYEQVVGFNYDWTKHPAYSGQLLADFLNDLKSRGLARADIEAHSFGTVTSLAALSAGTTLNIPHMILEGGPLNGTPIATLPPSLLTVIADGEFLQDTHGVSLPKINSLAIQDVNDMVNSGMLTDTGPGSPVLAGFRSNATQNHPETSFIKIVGTTTNLQSTIDNLVFQGASDDGVIPTDSATGADLPGPTALSYPISHSELECDPNTIRDVGNLVNSTSAGTPSIVISSVVSTIIDHNSLWTDYSVTVQGTTTGTPYNYSYEAGWGNYGLINTTLSSNPENWSFTFTYTQFAGPPTIIPIWAEEYDGSENLVASDYQSITLSY